VRYAKAVRQVWVRGDDAGVAQVLLHDMPGTRGVLAGASAMRQWNVVASMCAVLVAIYAAGCVYALVMDQINFKDFSTAILALLLPLLGYLARMLKVDQ
jgi:hypothetical protein